MERTPTGFIGMRKRTATWNLNGPSALNRQATFKRRGTLNLGGAAATAATSDHAGDAHSAAGFTLAGAGNALDSIIANQAYIDPGYVDLNPAYEVAPNARPVWGLAKPLPHVVRSGMIPTKTELLEQMPAQMTHEQRAREDFDLEAGRVQSTANPGKISEALRTARQDREFKLLRTYTGQSAIGGGRRRSSVSSAGIGRHSVPEQQRFGKSDGGHVVTETIRKLASVTEQSTPDEAAHSNEQGWINADALAPTPVNEKDEAAADDDDYWLDDSTTDELVKPYDPELDEIHNLHTHWSVIRLKFREPLAELLAVTCQLTLGFSADLAAALSPSSGTNTASAWGLATMTGIYIAGGISGAHLNPAMSLMLAFYRGFPLRRIPLYAFAQLLGAFLAALLAFALFRTSITDPIVAPSFVTYPRTPLVDSATAFLTEYVGTAILAIVVLALGDDSNAPPGAGMNAFIMGLVVVALSMALGYNTGLAMNPARDLGPRLALLALGYDTATAFPMSTSYWFWGAVCGPVAGALTGGFLYDVSVFVGGESPVNYPRKRIQRALKKKTTRWGKRLGSVVGGRRPKYVSDEWRFDIPREEED